MKIVVSGYYGHGNFGDEAILKSIISELNKAYEKPEIKVLSKLPNIKAIMDCDLFISGGGSLLQDVTSLRSLIYYLGLLYLAIRLKKKTMIYAQGIGPIRTPLGKKMLKYVLEKVDLITVRDEKSVDLLKSMDIEAELIADPVWALDYSPQMVESEKFNIGIQLRKWPKLDKKKLMTLAKAIKAVMINKNAVINLISLQDKIDLKVLNQFEKMLEGCEVRTLSGLTVEETVDYIASMDCLVAMRYHACLIAAKQGVPFMAITYDSKVKNLSKSTGAPFMLVKNMRFSMLANGINYLINTKQKISSELLEVSAEKANQASMSEYLKKLHSPVL